MARVARNTPWEMQFRLGVGPTIGERTSVDTIKTQFAPQLSRASNGRVALSQRENNPRVQIVEKSVAGLREHSIRVCAVVQSGEEFDTRDFVLASAEAVKAAGNPGFSGPRIADRADSSGNGCSRIDGSSWNPLEFFRQARNMVEGDTVFEVCVEYRRAPASTDTPAVAVPAGDSVAASLGSARVHASSRPEEVGRQQPTVTERIPRDLGNMWDSIPGEVKFAAGAIGVLAGLIGIGYVIRSAKMAVG